MGRSRRISLFMASVLLISLVYAHDPQAEVEDESAFSYGLETDKGPHNWANLNPDWKACGNGKLQSPIDLKDDRVVILPKLGNLRRKYKPAPAVIKNRGHDIMVEWKGDAGCVVINGTEYNLRQCHWHTPSEHTIDGKSLKMEIHLVHTNSVGQISVIGILYKLGRPDSFLEKLLHTVNNATHEGTNVGVMDPWEIKFGSRKYLRYTGSLTVPPCTEGVLWTILKKVRTVSREQIRALREAVHDGYEENARPIQDSPRLPVYMYRPDVERS